MVVLTTMLEKLPEELQRERVLGHTGKDINSHLYKHSIEAGHETLKISDYRIIGNGYLNNWKKQKIAEALLIKELKPTLNKHSFLRGWNPPFLREPLPPPTPTPQNPFLVTPLFLQ